MEEYEQAVASALDDSDPYFVREAYIIINSQRSLKEKTDALWNLFRVWNRDGANVQTQVQ